MRAGGAYGLTCVGCCINMIALMLVVGMASPLWTLGLTAGMAVQKHATWGPRLRLPFAVGLSLYGAGLAVTAIGR
jgi:predicted metal-binding membrane protein